MRTPRIEAIGLCFSVLACSNPIAPASVSSFTPRYDASAAATTVTHTNDIYFSAGESFPLCDGSSAFGDITWHEVVLQQQNPDGSYRYQIHFDMVGGGQATGPDGTQYVVHQVNGDTRIFDSPTQTFDLQGTVRINVLALGSGANLFYLDTITVHFDPVNGYSSSDSLTVDCRPST